MNNKVTLNEQTMEEVAAKINAAAEEIKNNLDKIKAEITEIDEVWKDENATIYMEKFQELSPNFVKFYRDAYNLSAFLKGVVNAYRENVMNPTATAVHGAEKN